MPRLGGIIRSAPSVSEIISKDSWPRDVVALVCTSREVAGGLRQGNKLLLVNITSRIVESSLWPHSICPYLVESVILQDTAPPSFYQALPRLRELVWIVQNPLKSEEFASLRFMFNDTIEEISPRFMFNDTIEGSLGIRLDRAGFAGHHVSLSVHARPLRVAHMSDGQAPNFVFYFTLRRYLQPHEREFGPWRHILGRTSASCTRDKAEANLKKQKIVSLSLSERSLHEVVMPWNGSLGCNIESYWDVASAPKWEIRFSFARSGVGELAKFTRQLNTWVSWEILNAKLVAENGGISCDEFTFPGVEGTWSLNFGAWGVIDDRTMLTISPPDEVASPVLIRVKIGHVVDILEQYPLREGWDPSHIVSFRSDANAERNLRIDIHFMGLCAADRFDVLPDTAGGVQVVWVLGKASQRLCGAREMNLQSPRFTLKRDGESSVEDLILSLDADSGAANSLAVAAPMKVVLANALLDLRDAKVGLGAQDQTWWPLPQSHSADDAYREVMLTTTFQSCIDPELDAVTVWLHLPTWSTSEVFSSP